MFPSFSKNVLLKDNDFLFWVFEDIRSN
jgi:hypothetical protein